MWDLIAVGLLYGPLLALGAVQLFGARGLFGVDTLKVFLWGCAFCLTAVPVLALIGDLEPNPDVATFAMAGARMLRIWAIIWTMAMAARIGGMIFSFLWRRRPRRPAV